MIISIFDNTTGKFLHSGHAKYDKDSDTYTGKDLRQIVLYSMVT